MIGSSILLVVQVLFDYILQLVATQPAQKKFIDIEEGWSMLDDASESYIEAFFRKRQKDQYRYSYYYAERH